MVRKMVMQMSKVTDQCRDIKELNILVQVLLNLALADIRKQGVNPLIVETYRSQERQNYLYCQGRTISEVTAKGINTTFATAYCCPRASKKTWTLNSVHKSRKAVDIVPQRMVDGRMTAIWNAKDKETQIIIQTMEKYGFEAGANWSCNPDSPHFQIKGDFTTSFMQNRNNKYITKAIQKALNKKLNIKLNVDGIWGIKTREAVNKFRAKQDYPFQNNGKLAKKALKDLFV